MREGSRHGLVQIPSRRLFGPADGDGGDDYDDKMKVSWGLGECGSSTRMGPCRNHVVASCPFCVAHKPAPPLYSCEKGNGGHFIVSLAGGEES